MKQFLVALLLLLPLTAQAADPLTEREVEQFIKTMEDARPLEDKYGDSLDLDADLSTIGEMADAILSSDGQVRFFTGLVQRPGAPKGLAEDLEGIARRNGFPGLDAMLSVGDRLFLALMKSGMTQKEVAEMQSIASVPDSQLSMMPPQMMPMITLAKAMGPALTKVPQSDMALAKKAGPRLEALGK